MYIWQSPLGGWGEKEGGDQVHWFPSTLYLTGWKVLWVTLISLHNEGEEEKSLPLYDVQPDVPLVKSSFSVGIISFFCLVSQCLPQSTQNRCLINICWFIDGLLYFLETQEYSLGKSVPLGLFPWASYSLKDISLQRVIPETRCLVKKKSAILFWAQRTLCPLRRAQGNFLGWE